MPWPRPIIIGFQVGNDFVVGYGMDDAGQAPRPALYQAK
jgi:hypoxanthine-guanine phosphoribosyltransferase